LVQGTISPIYRIKDLRDEFDYSTDICKLSFRLKQNWTAENRKRGQICNEIGGKEAQTTDMNSRHALCLASRAPTLNCLPCWPFWRVFLLLAIQVTNQESRKFELLAILACFLDFGDFSHKSRVGVRKGFAYNLVGMPD
jgi:hypothetical protein